jgi:hypothetical protein
VQASSKENIGGQENRVYGSEFDKLEATLEVTITQKVG